MKLKKQQKRKEEKQAQSTKTWKIKKNENCKNHKKIMEIKINA